MGNCFADHGLWRINEREFGKISEKDLTVKDFSGLEASGKIGCRDIILKEFFSFS